MVIGPETLVWLSIAAYVLFGLLLGLVDHALLVMERGRLPGLMPVCLICSVPFWPILLPGTLFRLCAGRWFGEETTPHLAPLPPGPVMRSSPTVETALEKAVRRWEREGCQVLKLPRKDAIHDPTRARQ